MFYLYIKSIIRNLTKNKFYTANIISGFSISMAVFFLLLAYVIHEYSVDGFHRYRENTYRLLQWNYMINDFDLTNSVDVTRNLQSSYPQIKQLTHVVARGYQELKINDIIYEEKAILSVDSSFLTIFDFTLLSGNRKTCLSTPYSIVLTESACLKYFGDANPLNRVVYIKDMPYNVSGVLADLDGGSHLKFEVLTSSSSFTQDRDGFIYICLTDQANADEFIEDINKHYKKIGSTKDEARVAHPFKLENLKDCYYTFPQSHHSHVFLSRDKNSLRVILLVMMAILFISSFNFVNFSQARIIFRSKEIIVYRLFGANIATAKIFVLETIILSAISLVVSVAITVTILPYFKPLTGFLLSFDDLISLRVLGVSFIIFVAVTLLLGLIAFFLCTKINLSKVFNGDNKIPPKPLKLLNLLVIGQIAISIVLAFISISITSQISFVENSSKGFNTENIIDINLMRLDSIKSPKLFKNEVLQIPGIVSASVCMGTPLDGRGYTHIELDSQTTELNLVLGDIDYLKTLGVEMTSGRGFSSAADSSYAIINEAALSYFKLDSDLQPIDDQGAKNVIGVVKNYHFRSFREKITPMEIHLVEKNEPNPFGSSRILVLIDGNDRSIITKLEETWKRVYFDVPFEYSFVSDTYFNLYEKERNFASLIAASCFISILITLFGLVGVTFFGAHRRLKEFAIRKIYGATVKSILNMSIRSAIKWTVLGSIIATPAAAYFINIWLNDFAYKSEPPILLDVFAVIFAAIITSLSVLYQTYIVAKQNPAEIIRHD